MTLVPRHRLLRAAAVLWLAGSLASLALLLTHPGLHGDMRTPLRALVPLYFMSLPLGHAGLMGFIELKLALYLQGRPPLGLLLEGVALWTALTALGYAQWFLLLPWAARQSRRLLGRGTVR